MIEPKRKNGRPKSNIFDEYLAKREGRMVNEPNLEMQRMLVLLRHKIWRSNRTTAPLLNSTRYRESDPIVYRACLAIEHAEILLGRKIPTTKFEKYAISRGVYPFGPEFKWFHTYIRSSLSRSKRKGQVLDPNKVFLTALTTVVARKLLMKKGGNPKVFPSPTHVAQVWYVLTGENEHVDSIRKRSPVVEKWCRSFTEIPAIVSTGKPLEIRKLAGLLAWELESHSLKVARGRPKNPAAQTS